VSFITSRRAICAASLLLLNLAPAKVAHGSAFQVSPVRITLSAQSKSALLSVRNESNEKLRFQVAVFAWDQNRQGEMVLKPTEDIVFFPVLLSVDPGEQRVVRVGTAGSTAATEKAYRMFVEELPPLEKAKENQIRVLTKMGVPIFFQPSKSLVHGQIEEMIVRRSDFSFEVKNAGNVHLLPREVQVIGSGSTGAVLFERQVQAWYILAGGSREYRLAIPRETCAKIKHLTVEVKMEEKTLRENFSLPPGSCDG